MTVETDIKKYSLNHYNRIITRYYERLSNEEDYDNLINIENKIASIEDCRIEAGKRAIIKANSKKIV